MGYQAKARDQQEGGKSDAVEYAKDGHDAKHGGSQERRLLLSEREPVSMGAASEWREMAMHTRESTMRWMRTKLQATTKVSIELEKVCV